MAEELDLQTSPKTVSDGADVTFCGVRVLSGDRESSVGDTADRQVHL